MHVSSFPASQNSLWQIPKGRQVTKFIKSQIVFLYTCRVELNIPTVTWTYLHPPDYPNFINWRKTWTNSLSIIIPLHIARTYTDITIRLSTAIICVRTLTYILVYAQPDQSMHKQSNQIYMFVVSVLHFFLWWYTIYQHPVWEWYIRSLFIIFENPILLCTRFQKVVS